MDSYKERDVKIQARGKGRLEKGRLIFEQSLGGRVVSKLCVCVHACVYIKYNFFKGWITSYISH